MTKAKRKSTVSKNIKDVLQARLDAEKAYKDMIGEAGGALIERIIEDNEGIETVEDVTTWYENVTEKLKQLDEMVAENDKKEADREAEKAKQDAELAAKREAEKARLAEEQAKKVPNLEPVQVPKPPVPGTPVNGSSGTGNPQPRPVQPVNGMQQHT